MTEQPKCYACEIGLSFKSSIDRGICEECHRRGVVYDKWDKEPLPLCRNCKNPLITDMGWETGFCNRKCENSFVGVIDPKLNPKHGHGSRKFKMSGVPACVLGEIGVAMTEGVHKYGAFNYRHVNINASTYYDAVMRHMMSYWEGEDIDPDSGLHHVTKAITSLVVLRDSMINGTIVDDRPKAAPSTWVAGLNAATEVLLEKYEVKDE